VKILAGATTKGFTVKTVAVAEDETGTVSATLSRFIGTRRGFDACSQALPQSASEQRPVSRRYSPEIGVVLAEVRGPEPATRCRAMNSTSGPR